MYGVITARCGTLIRQAKVTARLIAIRQKARMMPPGILSSALASLPQQSSVANDEQGDKMNKYGWKTRFISAQEVSPELVGAYPKLEEKIRERHWHSSISDLHDRLYSAGISDFVIRYQFTKTTTADYGAEFFHLRATIFTTTPINETSVELADPLRVPGSLP